MNRRMVVEITVVAAEGLPRVGRRWGKIDTYAVIHADESEPSDTSSSPSPVRAPRTEICRGGGRNPTWNQTLQVIIPEGFHRGLRRSHVLRQLYIRVEVYRHRGAAFSPLRMVTRRPADVLVGRAAVRLSELLEASDPGGKSFELGGSSKSGSGSWSSSSSKKSRGFIKLSAKIVEENKRKVRATTSDRVTSTERVTSTDRGYHGNGSDNVRRISSAPARYTTEAVASASSSLREYHFNSSSLHYNSYRETSYDGPAYDIPSLYDVDETGF